MALRTADTKKFSDARTFTQSPSVATGFNRAGPDLATSTAIQAFGELGGEFRLGQVEGQLEKELGEQGVIIATINDPDTRELIGPREEDGVPLLDFSISDPEGIIDQTSMEYKRIAISLDQGKISQQRGRIEAEVVLRRAISRAPGFAPQLRQLAQDRLGFNASSAALNQLFLSGPGPSSGALTLAQRDLEKAQQRVLTGHAINVDQGLEQVVNQRVSAGQMAKIQLDIQRGKLKATRLAVEVNNVAQLAMSTPMSDAMAEMTRLGLDGVPAGSLEAYKNAIRSSAISVWQATQAGMLLGGKDFAYDNESYKIVQDGINDIRDANIAILEDASLMKILSNKRSTLEDLLAIKAIKLAPELFVIKSLMGDNGIQSYIEMMRWVNGDDRQLKQLITVHPEYGYLLDLVIEARDVKPALLKISGKSERDLIPGAEEPDVPKETLEIVGKKVALDIMTGRSDPELIDAVASNLIGMGLTNTSMSMLANTPNSHKFAKPEHMQLYKDTFTDGVELVSNKIGIAIAGTNWALAQDPQTEKFMLIDRQGRQPSAFTQFVRSQPASQNLSPFSGGHLREKAKRLGIDTTPGPNVDRPSGIAVEELKALNDMYLPLMNDVAWRNEFDEVNFKAWFNKVTTNTNQRAIELELANPDEDDFIGNPDLGTTNLTSLDFTQQARLNNALKIGNQDEIFAVLEEAGMPAFNPNAQGSDRTLERLGESDRFIDLDSGQVVTFNKDGTPSSVEVGRGVLPGRPQVDVTAFYKDVGKRLAKEKFPILSKEVGDTKDLDGFHENLGRAEVDKITHMARTFADEHGVWTELVLSVIAQESGFNQTAVSDAKGIKGRDIGLFQMSPQAAEDIGDVDKDGKGVVRTDLAGHIEQGVKFLAVLFERYDGDVNKVLVAYNWGGGKLAEIDEDVKRAPLVVQSYIEEVLGRIKANG